MYYDSTKLTGFVSRMLIDLYEKLREPEFFKNQPDTEWNDDNLLMVWCDRKVWGKILRKPKSLLDLIFRNILGVIFMTLVSIISFIFLTANLLARFTVVFMTTVLFTLGMSLYCIKFGQPEV